MCSSVQLAVSNRSWSIHSSAEFKTERNDIIWNNQKYNHFKPKSSQNVKSREFLFLSKYYSYPKRGVKLRIPKYSMSSSKNKAHTTEYRSHEIVMNRKFCNDQKQNWTIECWQKHIFHVISETFEEKNSKNICECCLLRSKWSFIKCHSSLGASLCEWI